MNVPGFLLLVFGCLTFFGVFLARLGYWKVYWLLMVGIIAVFGLSVSMTWRPSTDDPIPAMMFLVIGVYGSIAAGAGMLIGLLVSKLIMARSGSL